MKKKSIFLGISLIACAVALASCGGKGVSVNTTGTTTNDVAPTTAETTPTQIDTTTPEETTPAETTPTETTTSSGDPEVQKYTVSWYNDGGQLITSNELNEGDQIVAPQSPSKDEDDDNIYTFKGWYTELTGGEEVTSFSTANSNVSYYARFEATAKVTVTFIVEGTEISSKIVPGSAVTAPENPTKATDAEYIYTFVGWYTAAEGGEEVTDFSNITSDTTYYARFEAAIKITVTFEANGTTFDTKYVKKGDKVSKPTTNPTKNGYYFVSWLNGATEFDFDSTIDSNITLTAKFEEVAETEDVGFGSSYTSWATLFEGSTRKDDKNRTYLSANDTDDVTVNGFTFKGKVLLDSNIMNTNGTVFSVNIPNNGSSIKMSAAWGSSSDSGVIRVYKGDVMIYESDDTYSKSNSTITLDLKDLTAGTYTIKAEKTNTTGIAGLKISSICYARRVEYVSVSFVTNSDNVIDPVSIKKGTKITEPTVSKSGFKFIGWYKTEDFKTGTEFSFNEEVNDTLVLYAKWEEISVDDLVTVSFTINVSGQTINSTQIEKGTKLVELPTLNIAGYRLNGWFLDANFQQAFNISNYTFNSDTELFAEYIKTYNVTFLDNDGNDIQTVTVDDDTLISENIQKPYISGYKFDYWYNVSDNQEFDIKTTTITSDLVLRAHYSVDENPVDKLALSKVEGFEESAYVTFNQYTLSGTVATDYKIFLDNQELNSDSVYISKSGNTYRADILGVKGGNHTVSVAPVIENEVLYAAMSDASQVAIKAYDRSGYAHFNNTEGVGAYNDDGTLKDNAIVLYVTDENKNTVELTYGGITVKGIGNILNSVGQECGEAGHEGECKKVSSGKTYYGKANTNQGILLKLAQDNIPLVVRFIGCVSNSGLYEATTFDANSVGKIEGLTAYDGIDYGGSEGDNGHMARMKSAKNITLEGVGEEATIDGWGFHLICETAYPDLAKNFEVRNLKFINTPEDAIGMEGQETESTLTITASVERCWVHHNTFIAPKIASPAESDKAEGDGSCDFKRGRYFTCSYNYFESCHKTNLVGSSKTSVQYNMSYHHNIWYNCAARQPLARRGNIHFYNNLIMGTTDTVSSLRADAYMFAEGNYYLGCSRPVEYKAEGSTGTCKSYNNNIIGCYNAYDATEVTDREAQVASNCKDNATNTSYANFDTNSKLFYYDSANKKSDCYLTDANQARIDCLEQSGSRNRTVLNNAVLKTVSDITTTASSATVSGNTSLTIAKGKGVLKVFTVTSPVTVSMAATANAGFDTGYLVKIDGTVVLELSTSVQTSVLMPGDYAVLSCVSFSGDNGKNDKETTVTTCTFEEFNSEELNAQLIAEYNTAHDAIPATIEYSDAHYQLIKAAMTAYKNLGTLQSEITNYADVTDALASYKTLGEAYVEGLINQIELPVTASNSAPIITARSAYNALLSKISDASVSNYQTLTEAESQMSALGVDIFLNNVNAIPATITFTDECNTLITNAEVAYAALDESQVKQSEVVTAYAKVVAARATYDNYAIANDVDSLIQSTDLTASKTELKAVMDAYNALTAAQKDLIQNTSKYDSICAKYVDVLISEIPATIDYSSMAAVSAARAAYDALTTAQKALVTSLAKLEAAEDEVAGLGVETLSTYTTTDFSAWDITGTTTTTTAGLGGKVSTANTISATSKFMMSQISNVTLNVTVEDKGSTTFTIYTSTDGTTWSQYYQEKSGKNKEAVDLSKTASVTGPVYVKIEITSSKGEGNAKAASINSITINK